MVHFKCNIGNKSGDLVHKASLNDLVLRFSSMTRGGGDAGDFASFFFFCSLNSAKCKCMGKKTRSS